MSLRKSATYKRQSATLMPNSERKESEIWGKKTDNNVGNKILHSNKHTNKNNGNPHQQTRPNLRKGFSMGIRRTSMFGH